jgi:hypothetical protein
VFDEIKRLAEMSMNISRFVPLAISATDETTVFAFAMLAMSAELMPVDHVRPTPLPAVHAVRAVM